MLHSMFKKLHVDYIYFLLFFVCFLVILAYGHYRCVSGQKDFLQYPLFPKYKHLHDLDGWSGSHFLFYMVIGMLYPKSFYLTITFGIMWECFEFFVAKYQPIWLQDFGFCGTRVMTDKPVTIWWYGKVSDLLVNFFGFIVGHYLVTAS